MKKHLSVTFLFIIFLIIPLYVKAQEPFQCDTPDYGKAGSKERCGVRGTDNLTIECDPADGELVCSSNEFNTCKTRVCLVGVGGKCGNNSICEGGSVCNIPSGQSEGRCDTSPDDDTASSSDLRDTIRRILNVILGFLGIITVVMVIYGGFMWLTQAHAFMGRSWRHSYRNRVDGFIIHFERGGEGGVSEKDYDSRRFTTNKRVDTF
ncbi:MAG: hypothetical protein UW39_C0014G0016 [Parcubacteria group bacterium GW2011_GWC2_44_17]|nr:MAG: hypothetical protein UW39_C0014G0016 [Parcubacteria group bacterium GW2011_GWC2_44_17]